MTENFFEIFCANNYTWAECYALKLAKFKSAHYFYIIVKLYYKLFKI